MAEGWRVRKNGTLFWASVVIDALHGPDGDVVGFAKVTRDLTQTHSERAALQEQLEMCRLIVEAAPTGMMIVNGAGMITLANSRVETIFGYPPGGLLNRSVDMLVPEMLRAGRLSKRESFASESLTRVMADGSAVPIEILLNPLITENGRLVVASVIDITERKHAQERLAETALQLREKNRLMAMAEEMSHVGHWRLDVKSNEVFWSNEMYRTFGLAATFGPTLEKSMQAYPPDDRDEARAVIAHAITVGTSYTRESRAERPDGSIRHVVVNGQPEYGADGTLIAIFGVLQDVTETREAEHERGRLFEQVNFLAEDLRVT